jgi:hypothetical protein
LTHHRVLLPDDILGLSRHFLNLVNHLNSLGKDVLILIDDIDAIPEDSMWIFVDQILYSLIREKQEIKFILTSGKQLEFKDRPQLYSYFQSQPIRTLNETDIRPLLPSKEELVPEVLRLSWGLPPRWCVKSCVKFRVAWSGMQGQRCFSN